MKTIKSREIDKEYHRRIRVENPGFKTEEWRKYRNKFPERIIANAVISGAIRRGKIKKLPCIECGKKDYVHAHHEDYSKPLAIIWLCPIHHKAYH